jgi:hypothetical protein
MDRMQSYHYFKPPLLLNKLPHPLPDVAAEPDWYSELWLRYPLDQQPYPMGFGHGMKALSELRVIMNDICAVSFHQSVNPAKIEWEQAVQFRKRLQKWYDALPDAISHSKLLFPAHLKLQ